jgi:hypothetical protein
MRAPRTACCPRSATAWTTTATARIDEPFADAMGRYTSTEHCGACGNNCNFIWTPAVNHATAYCDASLAVPDVRASRCASRRPSRRVAYDWVDANDEDDDGCECRRLSGNTNVDPPDTEFVDVLGARVATRARAPCTWTRTATASTV